MGATAAASPTNLPKDSTPFLLAGDAGSRLWQWSWCPVNGYSRCFVCRPHSRKSLQMWTKEVPEQGSMGS